MLESGNTRLRQIRIEDLDELAARLADGDVGPYYPRDFESVQELRARFAVDGFWSEREGRLLIEDLGGRVLGWIFYFRNHPILDSLEIAYLVFDPAERRRGHATRALGLLSRHLFRSLPVQRLELSIAEENLASRRVAEKAGFRFEGVMRQVWYSPTLDRRLDGRLYALLRGDLDRGEGPGR
jgi:RimJ/RimL family protein N-acetyltransferase